MAYGCDTCKYCGNDEQDPCRWCGFTNGDGSHWEPKDASEIMPDWYQAQAVRYTKYLRCEYLGTESGVDEMIQRLANVQMYLALAASALGISLGEIMMRSLERMRKISPEESDSDTKE